MHVLHVCHAIMTLQQDVVRLIGLPDIPPFSEQLHGPQNVSDRPDMQAVISKLFKGHGWAHL